MKRGIFFLCWSVGWLVCLSVGRPNGSTYYLKTINYMMFIFSMLIVLGKDMTSNHFVSTSSKVTKVIFLKKCFRLFSRITELSFFLCCMLGGLGKDMIPFDVVFTISKIKVRRFLLCKNKSRFFILSTFYNKAFIFHTQIGLIKNMTPIDFVLSRSRSQGSLL